VKTTTVRNKVSHEKRKRQQPMTDPYFAVVQEFWPHILMHYQEFEDKKPVMLFDIQEQRLYVYPYDGFKAELSERSQNLLEQQYERALAEQKIVVFVRDNDQKKLVSYSLDPESFEPV